MFQSSLYTTKSCFPKVFPPSLTFLMLLVAIVSSFPLPTLKLDEAMYTTISIKALSFIKEAFIIFGRGGGGEGGVGKIDRRKIKHPLPREYTGKKSPPPHDTVGKIPPPPPAMLKKTCLYVAVVLLQQLYYM